MRPRKIKTSKKDTITIVSQDPVIVDWFSRPDITHVDIIIDQINDGMYDKFMTKPDMTVVDAGANIGLFGLYALDSCARMVMVEPAPHNLYIMQEFLGDKHNVYIDNSALSSEDGTMKLNIHSSPTCNSIVTQSDTDLAIDVPTKCLKTLLDTNSLSYVDFLKCDIEGAEILAISDQSLEAIKNRLGSCLVETHNTGPGAWPGNLNENRNKLADIFKNNGYNIELIIHDQLYAYK